MTLVAPVLCAAQLDGAPDPGWTERSWCIVTSGSNRSAVASVVSSSRSIFSMLLNVTVCTPGVVEAERVTKRVASIPMRDVIRL